MTPSDVERQLRHAKSQLSTANSAIRKILIQSECDLERQQLAHALAGLEQADHHIDMFAHDHALRTMQHRSHAGELEF